MFSKKRLAKSNCLRNDNAVASYLVIHRQKKKFTRRVFNWYWVRFVIIFIVIFLVILFITVNIDFTFSIHDSCNKKLRDI